MKLFSTLLAATALISCSHAEANVFKVKFRGGRTSAVAAVAPVNTAVPTQTGIDREDETGTCSTGTWLNLPTSYTYARYRNGSTLIDGATSSTYVYTAADVGNTVECEVTATNSAGSVTARSLPTSIIAAASQVLAASQTIQFGERTRVGYGGHELSYAGAVYLGITGGTQGCDTKFGFNADKKLVPINGGAADGTVGPTYTAAACDITVAEYSGRTGSFPSYSYSGATGVTGTVTVNIVANAHSVAPRTTDTGSSHELRTVLSTVSVADSRGVRLGDTVYVRDGNWFNVPSYEILPAAYTQRAGGPAAPVTYENSRGQQYYGNASASYNGAGFVTVRPDTNYGATFKRLKLGSGTSGINWNLRLTRLNFGPTEILTNDGSEFAVGSQVSASTERAAILQDASVGSAARMLQIDNNRFYGDTYGSEQANNRNSMTGIRLKSNCWDCYLYDNEFFDLYTDVNTNFVAGDFIGNVSTGCGEDCVDGQSKTNTRIWWNKWFRGRATNYAGDGTLHGDFYQIGAATVARIGVSFVGNIMVANVPVGGQGAYFDDQTVNWFTGGEIKWNIYLDKFQNGIRCQRCDTWTIKYNTLLLWPGSQTNDTPPQISLGQSPNVSVNITNEKNIMAGASSQPTNVAGLDTSAEMLTYYDGPFTGDSPTATAGVLSALNPKAPAADRGALGTGANFTTQTITDPDGGTYLRPREAP